MLSNTIMKRIKFRKKNCTDYYIGTLPIAKFSSFFGVKEFGVFLRKFFRLGYFKRDFDCREWAGRKRRDTAKKYSYVLF